MLQTPKPSTPSRPRSPRYGALYGLALLVATGAAGLLGNGVRQRANAKMAIQPTRLAQANTDGDGTPYPLDSGTKSAGPADPKVEPWDAAEQTLDTVYSLVKQYYVDKVPTDQKMTQGALRSLLTALNDPTCYYLDPAQMQLLTAEGEGRFSGIGAALWVRAQKKDGYTEHKIVVVTALPGSPAERAGLRTGDIITHVNDKWVLGFDPYLRANRLMQQVQDRGDDASENTTVLKEVQSAARQAQGGVGLQDAMQVLRGDQTTITRVKFATETVSLTITRAGTPTPIKVTLTPASTDVNKVEPLSARVLPTDQGTLPANAAYVRIPVFTDNSAETFRRALDSVPQAARNRGIVLDLRNNPGGSIDAAIAIGEQLAPGGSFGSQVIAGGNVKALQPEKPSKANASPHPPVVILVNQGTANVAEALAASLVDKGVGTLVGGRTFGDATLQTAYSLPDGSAFVLATGRLQGPRSRWALTGLTPKIAVASLSEDAVLKRAVEALPTSGQVAAHR